MNKTQQTAAWFGRDRAIVGMIHVGALPGTPCSREDVGSLVRAAVAEAHVLTEGGVDAILLENMHDRPYLRQQVGPEIVAAMTAITAGVRNATSVALGVQVLAGANREALAVALASGCSFIRAENFAYAHVADEGLMAEADAGNLLRYRKAMGAEKIAVFADVKKKHSSHAITADVELAEASRTTEFFGADALIITGVATGWPTAPSDVQEATEAVGVPVLVGSGVTPENLEALWPYTNAFIVGSCIKHDGDWRNAPDPQRIQKLVAAASRLR